MPERRGPRGEGRWYGVVREIGLALVVAGVVVLLFVAYDLVGTNFAEQQSQARLAHEFRAALSRPTVASSVPSGGSVPTTTLATLAPAHPRTTSPAHPRATSPASSGPAHKAQPVQGVSISVPPGGALDHLVIPAIGVNRYVVEGVQEQDLQMGPGHYPGTPLPGQRGNVGIAGHRTTFGAPFFRLNELGQGDLIYLTDRSGTTWVYSVRRKWVVLPSDVAVLDPTRGADLTLTTCNPRFWATTRLVVRAVLVERLEPVARGAGRADALPARLGTSHPVRTGRARATPAAASAAPRAASGTSGTAARPARVTTGTSPSEAEARAAPTRGAPATSKARPETAPGSAVVARAAVTLGGPPTSKWASAFGFGALAVAVWVATRLLAARRHRYAKVAWLMAGALVSLVPLWFAFGAAVDLLPANF